MVVYQYNKDGYFAGITDDFGGAMPHNCTDKKPLEPKDGFNIKWNGDAWEYEEIPEISLDELKAKKWQQIKTARDKAEQAGLPYMDKILDSDTISVQRITTAVQAAQMAMQLKKEFVINWTTQDNSTLTMTAEDVCGIPFALAQYSDGLHAKARELREQIEVTETAEELEQIVWD